MLNFQELPIDSLSPSPTNPRKRFNEKELQDLAASIKEKGVMQPILARPMPGLFESYEIVAGERRWRASKLAGLETIPATVRELDDIETLQLQIIENMQRSDLHPLEEAQALQNMLQATGSNGHKQWTHEELGAKIGKSRSYVFASLNLLKLSNFAKDKFLEDKFGRETALLISRIPGEKLQERLVKDISERELSYRAAKDYIHRDFTFDLTKATWDKFDETVLAETPSCAKCPKRSGNYPELHPDIESPDVCTDPTCYSNKKAAYADRVIKTMPRVIHGDEAKQVAPYGYNTYITNGYVRSLDNVIIDGFSAAEVLGDQAPEPFTLIDETKNIGAVYDEKEVKTLLREKLQEKLESGELQPKKASLENQKENELKQKKQARADELTPFLKQYFVDRIKQINQLLIADDIETKSEFYELASERINKEARELMFLCFEKQSILEFTPIELLLADYFAHRGLWLNLDKWNFTDDLELRLPDHSSGGLIQTLEKLTGVALPPLPAAQAQKLTPADEAPEPVAEPLAAEAAPTVETSEPATTPTPAPLDAEKAAEAARFAAIREKAEAKRARKAAKESQKESAQADA